MPVNIKAIKYLEDILSKACSSKDIKTAIAVVKVTASNLEWCNDAMCTNCPLAVNRCRDEQAYKNPNLFKRVCGVFLDIFSKD